ALRPRRHLREARVHASEAPRREGRATAPRCAGREADRDDPTAGGVSRRPTRGSVQAGPLSLLSLAASRAVAGAHDVADLSLADVGEARIAWADQQMPVLAQIRRRFEAERPLDGVHVAGCLHVTAETANLICALIAGGARAALCSANPMSVQDDVAAAL